MPGRRRSFVRKERPNLSDARTAKVVVVGAGPAGAAVSLLLARAGVSVLLVERERTFDRVFRGEGLMPSGADALFQMGLGGLLATLPNRVVEAWDIWMDGRLAFSIPEQSQQLGPRAMRVISQPALLASLIEEATRYETFEFKSGARARDLVRSADGRVIGVLIDASGKDVEVETMLVIGCDGRGSPLRHMAGLELVLDPEHYDVLWAKLPPPHQLVHGCRMQIMVAGGRDPAICYTSWDGRLQYGLIRSKADRRGLTEQDWLDAAVGVAPGWLAEHMVAQQHRIEGPQRLNVAVGRCRAWSKPGLLLLGDAAHPMSPVRAQGVNLALRDAIVAANHLVPVLRANPDRSALDQAVVAVQREREPEIVRAQQLQRIEAAGQAAARGNTLTYRAARRLAPLLGRYRWAQQAWLRRQHGLRHGITAVHLRV